MKKIIAFGMILSMICNHGTLIKAAESQVVPMEQVVFRAEMRSIWEIPTELENKEEKNDIF